MLKPILAFVLLVWSSVSVSAPVAPSFAHHITFDTILEGDSCSATAVGPHALLTAAHCMIGTDQVNVDGQTVRIISTLYDNKDHEILIVDSTYTIYLGIDQRVPQVNEHVRMYGFPGNRANAVAREGYYEKLDIGESVLYVYVLPCYPGDSGAGLITDDGKVISTVSLGNTKAETATFILAFTADQLKAATAAPDTKLSA